MHDCHPNQQRIQALFRQVPGRFEWASPAIKELATLGELTIDPGELVTRELVARLDASGVAYVIFAEHGGDDWPPLAGSFQPKPELSIAVGEGGYIRRVRVENVLRFLDVNSQTES